MNGTVACPSIITGSTERKTRQTMDQGPRWLYIATCCWFLQNQGLVPCHRRKTSFWLTTSWSWHSLLMTSDRILKIYVRTWKWPAKCLNHTMTSWDANLCPQVLSSPLSWRFQPLSSSHRMLQGESDDGNHHMEINGYLSQKWHDCLNAESDWTHPELWCTAKRHVKPVGPWPLQCTENDKLVQVSFCIPVSTEIVFKKGIISMYWWLYLYLSAFDFFLFLSAS